MPGRARAAFAANAETAGLEPPPRGALAGYAEETLAQIPQLRARCGDDDDEKLHALRECEAAARGLLSWIEDTPARRPSRASRAARGTPAQAGTPAPAPRASRSKFAGELAPISDGSGFAEIVSETRTASVRDRYRRRTR